MMGVADFPIEFLKLLKIAPKDDAPNDTGAFSQSHLKLLRIVLKVVLVLQPVQMRSLNPQGRASLLWN